MQLFGWIASLALYSLLTFFPLEAHRGNLPPAWQAAIFQSLSHTAYGAIFAWIVFATATGHAKWLKNLLTGRTWKLMANLSFMLYLVHPIVFTMHAGRGREREYWSHYDLLNTAVWVLIISLPLALLLQLFLVTPLEWVLGALVRRPVKDDVNGNNAAGAQDTA